MRKLTNLDMLEMLNNIQQQLTLVTENLRVIEEEDGCSPSQTPPETDPEYLLPMSLDW